jgi:alginate O-acetyltransferase complex protein AlgI
LVFSSLLFLFAYLPSVLAVYYILPRSCRNAFLFFASLLFYAWGEPVYVLLMLFTITFGWSTGLMLGRWKEDRSRARAILLLDIVVNIGLLGFFKYGNFIVANLNQLAGLSLKSLDLPLPLGISFYTFQTMSYTFDVYRGDAPVQPNLLSFGAYVALFPQLIAGPIVRYNTIAEQLDHRRESVDQFGQGAGIFVIGLAKKVLLANNLGVLWSQVKALPQGEMTLLAAWAGIAVFGLQLYFDFSGYSDMAVGLGRMLGFRFERNFFYPYVSTSITEFWRHWHISLSTWFREYLYIPLGGGRRGAGRTIANLFAVWAVTGFWHGANWNFIYWGLYYFAFLVCEKYLWGSFLEMAPKAFRHLYTLIIVMAGWALFVFDDAASLGTFLQAMGGQVGGGWFNDRIMYYLSSMAAVLLAAVIGATPLAVTAFNRATAKWPMFMAIIKPTLVLAGLLLSTMYLVDSSYNPFLYFRF